MISDEEKKEINLLKSYENKLVYEISEKDKKAVKTVLNLIEKQQKEIEELHKEINQRIKLKLENERCADEDFIYKDKIKAKIEEYDDKGMAVNLASRSAGKTFQQAVHYEVKKVLQSLLEKE